MSHTQTKDFALNHRAPLPATNVPDHYIVVWNGVHAGRANGNVPTPPYVETYVTIVVVGNGTNGEPIQKGWLDNPDAAKAILWAEAIEAEGDAHTSRELISIIKGGEVVYSEE